MKGSPGMHRGIDVAEILLVRRKLTVRVLIDRLNDKIQLVFGKIPIHHLEGKGMEGQVPRGIPGVFPLVRHGDDGVVDHVEPIFIPHGAAAGLKKIGPMLLQPFI
jgi:hypothetical protein